MNEHDIRQQLAQYGGTTRYYRHAINSQLLLTDGAYHLRELTKSHWLINDIALYLPTLIEHAHDHFYVIRLDVIEDEHGYRRATLVFDDGQGAARNIWYEVDIPYTDFPLRGETTLYLAQSTEGYVLMLPNEY